MRTRHVVLVGLVFTCAPGCATPSKAPAAEPESPSPLPGYVQQPGSTEEPPSPPPPEPLGGASSTDENAFASIAEAEAALDRAQAELNPKPAADKAGKTDQDGPARPKDSTTPRPTATPQREAPDPCVNACKAFASLKRAAVAVCRLAGEADARCKRAQSIVSKNETRMTACKCAANGE